MKTTKKRRTLALSVAVLAVSSFVSPPAAQAQNGATVNGGGGATLTADGLMSPVRFGLAGVVQADGSAEGHVNFVFPRPFAEVWGAVPGVDLIHIEGRVTSGSVAGDGTIILEGTLTERDYTKGLGVVFLEENVPFTIAVGGGLGPNMISLQWCFLPVFPVEVTHGTLEVH